MSGRPHPKPHAPRTSPPTEDVLRDLKRASVFHGLSDADLQLIAGHCHRRSFYRGEAIFEDSDLGDDLFIILSGRVTIRLESISPHYEMVISSLGEGQVFGEMALLEQEPRSATVVCSEATETLQIDGAALRAIFEDQPRLGYLVVSNLARTLCERLHQMNRRLLGLMHVNLY